MNAVFSHQKEAWVATETMRPSRIWVSGPGSGTLAGFFYFDQNEFAGVVPFDTKNGYLVGVGGYFPSQCSLYKVLEISDSYYIEKLFNNQGRVLFNGISIDSFSCPSDTDEAPLLLETRYAIGGETKDGAIHSIHAKLEQEGSHFYLAIEESIGPYNNERSLSPRFRVPLDFKEKILLRIGSAHFVVSGLQRTKNGVTVVAFIKEASR